MRILMRYKVPVRTQAYVLLGVSFSWWAILFVLLFNMGPENAFEGILFDLLLLANLVLGVILWISYRKGGRVHTRLVRLALFAAALPWLISLTDFLNSIFG